MIEVKTKQDILLTKGTICLIVYQPWCGYCQMLKKLIIDKNLEKKYPKFKKGYQNQKRGLKK